MVTSISLLESVSKDKNIGTLAKMLKDKKIVKNVFDMVELRSNSKMMQFSGKYFETLNIIRELSKDPKKVLSSYILFTVLYGSLMRVSKGESLKNENPRDFIINSLKEVSSCKLETPADFDISKKARKILDILVSTLEKSKETISNDINLQQSIYNKKENISLPPNISTKL